jgi:hypothetical protein
VLQGYLLSLTSSIAIEELSSALFGPTTRLAVVEYQDTHQLPATGTVDNATWDALRKEVESQPPSFHVLGLIRHPNDTPGVGLTVRAFDRDLRSEELLGEASTDKQGYYRISYTRDQFARAEKDAADLFLRVFRGTDGLYDPPIDATVFNAPSLAIINVDLASGDKQLESEYERILNAVKPLLGSVPLEGLEESNATRDITFLAGETGLATYQLAHFAVAHKLASAHKIAPEFFYALLAENTLLKASLSTANGVRFDIGMGTELVPLFYDIVLLPADTIRKGVRQAIADNLIPQSLERALDDLLKQLSASVAEAQAYVRDQRPKKLFEHVQRFLAAGKHEQVLAILQQDSFGDLPALLQRLQEASVFTDKANEKIAAAAATLSDVLGYDAQISEHIRKENGIKRPEDVRDLARLNRADWSKLLGTAASSLTVGDHPIRESLIDLHASALVRTMEKRFPTTAFAAQLERDKTAGPEHRELLGLLERHPEFDLASGNIDLLLKARSTASAAAADHDAELAKTALKSMQRVFKVAPTYGKTKALLEKGLNSAASIHAVGETRFISSVTADEAFTPAEALTAYRKASDIHTASALLAGQLQGAAASMHVSALGADTLPHRLDEVAKDFPNIKSLFHLADYCACKECRSVHSAAAYLVDTLQFLKNRLVVDSALPPPAVSVKIAKDVLFERRPDLGDTDLNCDNSNTPVSYIDMVCELLEDAVAPDPGIAFAGPIQKGYVSASLLATLRANGLPITDQAAVFDADRDGNWVVRDKSLVCKLSPAGGANQWIARRLRQTFGKPEELAAAPEYLNTAAYEKLRTSTLAFHLPFDLFHQEAHAYFAQFDVARADLMRALQTAAGPLDHEIAAEAWGLSDEERQLIGTARGNAADQNAYWGSGTLAAAEFVKVVENFLTKTGLAYAELQELLACEWVNPGAGMFIRYLDNSVDVNNQNMLRLDVCDLTRQEIQNLDNTALDRLHRFIRLWKKTGWSSSVLDRVVRAPRLGNGLLDDACLVRLQQLVRLQTRLGIQADELCNFYDIIPSEGNDSRYAQVFLNATANGTVNEDFLPENVHLNELAELALPGSEKKLAAYKSYLALCLGARAADCERLVDALGATAILSFHNIAQVYALNRLQKALGLSAADLLILKGLSGSDPLAAPADTLRFLEKLAKVRASGMTLADLQYVLAHQADNLADRVFKDEAITSFLMSLRSLYQAAFADNHSPFDPAATADENKGPVTALLAKLPDLANGDLSLFQSMFNDAWNAPPSTPALTPAQFIDQKLATYVETTPIKAAHAALASAVAPKEAERKALVQSVADALSQYFFATAKAEALTGAVIRTFKLAEDVATTVLTLARLKQPAAAGNQTLLDLLTDDALIRTANTPPELPPITPAAFEYQFRALRLLHTINLLLGTLKLSGDALRWMLGNNAALGWMELDNLAYETGIAPVEFEAWERLQGARHLASAYPPVTNPMEPDKPFSVYGLFDLVQASGTAADVPAYLAKLTGWDEGMLRALDAHFGFSSVDMTPYRHPATYLQLEAAIPLLRKLGVDLPAALSVTKANLTAADAALMRQALKARYAEADWLGVLKGVQDPLRQQKRDALVAFLLYTNPNLKSTDDLYDHFLIDVEMCSCMPTSRIVQAHATIQLFVQRCLMGLEPRSVANVKHDAGWEQWKWMANYRVWEANRKIFLYPENWIDPQLRDDKSELFTALENTLHQNALTDLSVENAATRYLEELDDIAQLDVMATYYQADLRTLHVFARTKGGDPAIYYHRQFRQEQVWTPWKKLDHLDITGDHLLAFERNGRLNLAWPVFTRETDPDAKAPIPDSSQQGHPVTPEKAPERWRVKLAVSMLAGTDWTPVKISKGALGGDSFPYSLTLQKQEDFVFFVWGLGATQAVSCTAGGTFYGSFTLTGCKGYPEPSQAHPGAGLGFLPQFKDSVLLGGRFTERMPHQTDDLAIKTILNLASFDTIVNATPGTFRTSYPMQMSVIDWIFLWLELASASQTGAVSRTKGDGKTYIPLGTFMPYCYGDVARTYAIVPGLYESKAVEPKHGTEKTFSDIFQFAADAIALLAKYLQVYQQDPAHDLSKLLQQLVSDDEYLRLRKEYEVYRSLQYGVKFKNLYHPLLCFLRTTLYREGIPGVMRRDNQLRDTGFDFIATYRPSGMVAASYPREDIDFDKDGAYSSYNWELFFHLPFAIAMRLSQDQQFEAARTWFHYIFNPVGASDAPAPQKYWVTKPFFQTTVADYLNQRIDNVLYSLAADPTGAVITDLKAAVAEWREKPFSPHAIARYRPMAYQLAVVTKYVQNLIDWGDNLFRQFTRESVTQATQMYILADKLLGPKPRIVPAAVGAPAETYNQLEAHLDLFSNALLDLENLIPDLGLLPHGGAELPPPPIAVSSLYFCIPPNDNMLQYWDKVSDRLYKIRHCQNIDGVESILALFSPPIDPGALVRATAAGLDISTFLTGLGTPLPHYRFNVMAQKASELAQQVSALGNSLLQALEKRDAEALARLRSHQEITVLSAVRAVKEAAIKEAEGTVAGLTLSRAVTEARRDYYAGQHFVNLAEGAALGLSGVAMGIDLGNQIAHAGAAVVQAQPQVEVGIAGGFGSPFVTVTVGGPVQGQAAKTAADVLSIIAHAADRSAAISATLGSYMRRQDEWDFQVTVAKKELVQIDQQKATAQLHVEMLNRDLEAHDTQAVHATETDLFMRSKYTNQELYDWMIGQTSSVYFKAYQLAFDVAKKAERCFGHELGSEARFLSFGYWDSLKKGLTAADALSHDIKRMEAAYLDQNKREYELTKHVSLGQLDPEALLQLKNTGKCLVQVPEAAFDLDHPGHYMRRHKSVSLSIPCVAPPFTSVSCKLSLISNRYRNSPALRQGASTDKEKYLEDAGNDPRFTYNVGTIQSVATSGGQSDSGMFELNFRDERYLPFEGTGATATWQLELPSAFRQFDYGTISDVILHLHYTARDGGSGFRSCVEGGLRELLNEMALAANRDGLFQAYNLRQQFPNEWWQLKQEHATHLTIGMQYLPFLAQGHTPVIDQVTWFARVDGDPATYVMAVDQAGFTLNRNASLGNLCTGSTPSLDTGAPFTLSTADASKLKELTMMLHYSISS